MGYILGFPPKLHPTSSPVSSARHNQESNILFGPNAHSQIYLQFFHKLVPFTPSGTMLCISIWSCICIMTIDNLQKTRYAETTGCTFSDSHGCKMSYFFSEKNDINYTLNIEMTPVKLSSALSPLECFAVYGWKLPAVFLTLIFLLEQYADFLFNVKSNQKNKQNQMRRG